MEEESFSRTRTDVRRCSRCGRESATAEDMRSAPRARLEGLCFRRHCPRDSEVDEDCRRAAGLAGPPIPAGYRVVNHDWPAGSGPYLERDETDQEEQVSDAMDPRHADPEGWERRHAMRTPKAPIGLNDPIPDDVLAAMAEGTPTVDVVVPAQGSMRVVQVAAPNDLVLESPDRLAYLAGAGPSTPSDRGREAIRQGESEAAVRPDGMIDVQVRSVKPVRQVVSVSPADAAVRLDPRRLGYLAGIPQDGSRTELSEAPVESENRLVAEQAPPQANSSPAVWSLVMRDMVDRDVAGAQKYGVRLQPNNGRDALVDAYQEALDLVVYLRQSIYERDGK